MAKTARKATKAKKPAAKKTAAKSKKTAAKKAAAPAKVKTYKESLNKSKLLEAIADNTGLAKKEVAAVFESLGEIINGHIKPRAVGKINFLGLFNIEVRTKPATKARKGTNPFTGEEMMFKAKPARKVVKIKPLKKLKEMAEK